MTTRGDYVGLLLDQIKTLIAAHPRDSFVLLNEKLSNLEMTVTWKHRGLEIEVSPRLWEAWNEQVGR